MFEFETCWDWLASKAVLQTSIETTQQLCQARTGPNTHGDLPRWKAAIDSLPVPSGTKILADASVQITGTVDSSKEELVRALMQLHPWRKGPWNYFGVEIDTEWRSNLKWDRLANSIELKGHSVLDVGCGNGYYGWRMLAAGAEAVVGCDPTLLYLMQFEASKRYAADALHWVLPMTDQEVPSAWNFFDTVFSMGVLYHRTSPIDHLLKLKSCLKPGGQLVLETLIVSDDEQVVLCPTGRYAKMRNVWMIPSVSMLSIWLKRTGFQDIQVVDTSPTTIHEQRSTDWMTFESLADFLKAEDSRKTVEGYTAPHRGLLLAQRK